MNPPALCSCSPLSRASGKGTLFEAGRPAAGRRRSRLDFFDVFRPVKWIRLVFGRYVAVSGQDWVLNDDRTLSQTCVFQCYMYSQIMKELTFAFRNRIIQC